MGSVRLHAVRIRTHPHLYWGGEHVPRVRCEVPPRVRLVQREVPPRLQSNLEIENQVVSK